jgi:hypothetical protein
MNKKKEIDLQVENFKARIEAATEIMAPSYVGKIETFVNFLTNIRKG